jgi:hypothetical protein
MASTNFYFGRLNFKHQLTTLSDYDPDKDREQRIFDVIWKYINSDKIVFEERTGDRWRFGACVERDGLIFGKFGKIFPDRPMTFDEKEGDFKEEDIERENADYSQFLIAPSKNVVVFNSRQHIGYRQFQEAFSKGYSNFYNLDSALGVTLLKDSGDVEQIIGESSVKKRISALCRLIPLATRICKNWMIISKICKLMG